MTIWRACGALLVTFTENQSRDADRSSVGRWGGAWKDNELRLSADYLASGTYSEAVNFYATLQANRELAKASSVWGLEQFPAEGQQWNCNQCFKWLLYCKILHRVPQQKYLNTRGLFLCRYQILQGILHGDAKFSREFCMGMPNSLGNFAWDAKFPVQ